MPHALAPPDFVSAHPELRATDLHQAFADPTISGIFASIGGDDAIRLLPHLNLDVIRHNPKVFLGFSDTTAIHLACLVNGQGRSKAEAVAELAELYDASPEAVAEAIAEFEEHAMRLVPKQAKAPTE